MKQGNRVGGSLQKALNGEFTVKPMDIMKEAWQLNKSTFVTLLGAILITFAILIVVTMLGITFFVGADAAMAEDPRMMLLVSAVQVLVYPPMLGALYLMGIRNSVGKRNQARDVLSLFSRPITLIAVAVAVFLLQQASLILIGAVSPLAAVVINIAINLFLALALPLVAEYRLSATKALQTSFIAVSKDFFNILTLYAMLLVLVLVSVIPFGLGLIWTLPLTFNAIGILYREIFGVEADNNSTQAPTDEENSSDTWTA
ncbi:hypothetical protein ACR0ST_05350 [Aliidiomarina sp. Khilg15.8]